LNVLYLIILLLVDCTRKIDYVVFHISKEKEERFFMVSIPSKTINFECFQKFQLTFRFLKQIDEIWFIWFIPSFMIYLYYILSIIPCHHPFMKPDWERIKKRERRNSIMISIRTLRKEVILPLELAIHHTDVSIPYDVTLEYPQH